MFPGNTFFTAGKRDFYFGIVKSTLRIDTFRRKHAETGTKMQTAAALGIPFRYEASFRTNEDSQM